MRILPFIIFCISMSVCSITLAAECKYAFNYGGDFNECREGCIEAGCEGNSQMSSEEDKSTEGWCTRTCGQEFPCQDGENCSTPSDEVNKT
jgi:hypothetical protein